jgi:hypothetical protein
MSIGSNLNEVDFGEHGKVMTLDPGKNQNQAFAGDVVKDFRPTAPFKFLRLER